MEQKCGCEIQRCMKAHAALKICRCEWKPRASLPLGCKRTQGNDLRESPRQNVPRCRRTTHTTATYSLLGGYFPKEDISRLFAGSGIALPGRNLEAASGTKD